MTIKSSTDLKTSISGVINDNTTQDITAADVRESIVDVIDSIPTVVGESPLVVPSIEINGASGLKLSGSGTQFDDFPVDICWNALGGANAPPLKLFKNDGSGAGLLAINFDAVGKYGYEDMSTHSAFTSDLSGATWTLEAWIKPSSSSNDYKTIFGQAGKFEIGTRGNKLYWKGPTGPATIGTLALNIGAWNHVTFRYTGGLVTMTLNGASGVSTALTQLTGITGTWYVGSLNATTQPLLGAMCQFLLYNKFLTTAQVLERYNGGMGTDDLPTGIVENADISFRFRIDEGSGSILTNDATREPDCFLTLVGSPSWVQGVIGVSGSFGIYLPTFEHGEGQIQSIYWEMPHRWKTSTPLYMHMHVSNNTIIPANSTIVFSFEYTIQDLYGDLNSDNNPQTTVFRPAAQFANSTVITRTLTTNIDIPAYSNLIISFGTIDMSSYTSVSTTGVATIRRETGTYLGDLHVLQTIRGHYEIDSIGSNQIFSKSP